MAQPIVKGYLGYLSGDRQYLKFQWNPTTIDRDRVATYAKNAASLADFPNSKDKQAPAMEWIRNEAEEFSFDLLFHRDGNADVEEQLKKLDKMMQPDRSTGEPRDLVLVMGVRSDRVRITRKRVKERLFSPDLKVQEALVSLSFTALRSRSA